MRSNTAFGSLLVAAGCGAAPATPENAAASETITLGDVPWQVGDEYLCLSTALISPATAARSVVMDVTTAANVRVRAVGPDGPTKIDVWYDAAIERVSTDGELPVDQSPIERGLIYTVWREPDGLKASYADGSPVSAAIATKLGSIHSQLGLRGPGKWLVTQPWRLGEPRHADAAELTRMGASMGAQDAVTALSATLDALTADTAAFTITMRGFTSAAGPEVAVTWYEVVDRATGRSRGATIVPQDTGPTAGALQVQEVVW